MSDLTRAEAIAELTEHLNHWQRLMKEGICGKEYGERTIKSFELAVDSLKTDLTIKEAYDKGYKDGQEALAYHLELCKEEQEPCECTEYPCLGKLCRYYKQPCEDAISRQAVLDMVEDMTDQFGVEHRVITGGVISMLPPVTPKPKTGHWILTDDDFVYCSECEDSYYPRPIDASWYYCPHCGCKMFDPQESEG